MFENIQQIKWIIPKKYKNTKQLTGAKKKTKLSRE